MFLPRLLGPSLLALSFAVGANAETAGPGLGAEIAAEDLAAWDISIAPDAEGLPEGAGSVADGAGIYAEQCAQCHGENGMEGPVDPLAGGIGSLTSEAPAKTVGSFWPYATTLFDYTRRAMPYDAPQSLGADELYAVTAYMLHLNGILEADATLDAAGLAAVEMPNKDGFVSYWPKAPE